MIVCSHAFIEMHYNKNLWLSYGALSSRLTCGWLERLISFIILVQQYDIKARLMLSLKVCAHFQATYLQGVRDLGFTAYL